MKKREEEKREKQEKERQEAIIKLREVEDEIDKCAKGFVRAHQFDDSMSVVAMNFGLKLYNL